MRARSISSGFVHVAMAALALAAAAGTAVAGETERWDGAPPAFATQGGTAVPIDIESVHVEYTFDYAAQRASARAVMRFEMSQDGFPIFDLVPNATALSLDGQSLSAALLTTVSAPDQATRMRVLRQFVPADGAHELTIDFALSSQDVTWSSGRVRVGFFISDLTDGGRAFYEKYGPANFEFDHVKYTFRVRVTGVTAAHEVFANGVVETLGQNDWSIDFPDYFTASSLYFHLADVGRFQVQRFNYQGLAATIPVTVYSQSSSLTASAVSDTRRILAELEGTYGPTTHPTFTIYVTPSGGGMEHCGATMTSLGALGHELTHSWFARGVMPADGNSGWIDEAIASWRDNGYPRASGAPSRSPVNLGAFSSYRRHTPQAAYSSGARLISELDYMASGNGGMKQVLRQLYTERQRTVITTGFFRSFLESATGRQLGAIFDRYVYGRSSAMGFVTVAPEAFDAGARSAHPRRYTQEELERFR